MTKRKIPRWHLCIPIVNIWIVAGLIFGFCELEDEEQEKVIY